MLSRHNCTAAPPPSRRPCRLQAPFPRRRGGPGSRGHHAVGAAVGDGRQHTEPVRRRVQHAERLGRQRGRRGCCATPSIYCSPKLRMSVKKISTTMSSFSVYHFTGNLLTPLKCYEFSVSYWYNGTKAEPAGGSAGLDMRQGGQQHLRRGRLQSESASSAPPLLPPTPEASSPTGDAGRRVLVTRAGSAVA